MTQLVLRAADFAGPAPAMAAAPPRMFGRRGFDTLQRAARGFFTAPPADQNHERMRRRNGYFVAAGGDARPAWAAPTEEHAVEIAYGGRSIGNFHDLDRRRMRLRWRAVSEAGARLIYSREESGVVSVYLLPAYTDLQPPEEDAILLDRLHELAPSPLRHTLTAHWRAFRAYAETTSLEGEPTPRDRLLVRWLRLTRRRARRGRLCAPRAITAAWSVLGMAAALGVGFLAALV